MSLGFKRLNIAFFRVRACWASLFFSSYGTSQLLGPSLESQCTAGTRVELPHINCASDHRWTYPSCGQQCRACGSTLTTNSLSSQLLHTIYCIPLLTASQIVFVPLHTQHRQGTGWCSLLRHRVADSIPDGVIGMFSLNYSFRQQCGTWFDTDSNSNEYPGKRGL